MHQQQTGRAPWTTSAWVNFFSPSLFYCRCCVLIAHYRPDQYLISVRNSPIGQEDSAGEASVAGPSAAEPNDGQGAKPKGRRILRSFQFVNGNRQKKAGLIVVTRATDMGVVGTVRRCSTRGNVPYSSRHVV